MRQTPRNIALLVLAAVAGMPVAAASAAEHPTLGHQHPILRSHPPPPFGRAYRAVCGPVPIGWARCLADVITVPTTGTNGGATPLMSSPLAYTPQAAPMVTPSPYGYGPADLQDAYGIVSEASSAGGTQTVAVVDAYDDPTAESDLATYRSAYGLTACTTANGCFRKRDQRGGTSYPGANSNWAGEISLDLDAVSAICPNCHILLMEADTASVSNLMAAANEAAVLGATQISNSYSIVESPTEATSWDPWYSHSGVAVTASSGDDGYGTGYPATSAVVTGVGGTTLNPAPTTTRGWTETAWSGSGSGCSAYEPKPSWQTDVLCAKRMVSDVSAVADPATGAAVYNTGDGGWAVYGGTSLSAPIVAAYDALIGFAAWSPQYPYTHGSSYWDVASGSNGSCGGSYLCTALTGYDGPTGLGAGHGAGLHRSPTVGTGSASSIDSASATVSGTVNPNGSTTTYKFDYGTSTTYGLSTNATSAGSGSSYATESAALSGLAGSTTYHFRIEATNSYGTHYGSDRTLTTAAPPPPPSNTVRPHVTGSAQVGAALAVSAGTWTGDPTSYAYQWWRCVPSSGGGCTPSAIDGATSSTYTTASTDVNDEVWAVVQAGNANGWSPSATSDNGIWVTAPPVPSNTAPPYVSGDPVVGATLSVSTGSWTGSPDAYDYEWIHCMPVSRGAGCTPSQVGAGTSYVLSTSDLGGTVYAWVRAHNAGGWSSFVISGNELGPITAAGLSQTTIGGGASIKGLAIKPSVFRAARKGTSISPKGGVRVSLRLTSRALVSFTVERVASGRRVGNRCVAAGPRNRSRPPCTLYVTVSGSFRYPAGGFAPAGSVSFRFTGRLAGRSLAPGSYRLVAVARGPSGARSAIARVGFRIVR